jgi:hypothetical protein
VTAPQCAGCASARSWASCRCVQTPQEWLHRHTSAPRSGVPRADRHGPSHSPLLGGDRAVGLRPADPASVPMVRPEPQPQVQPLCPYQPICRIAVRSWWTLRALTRANLRAIARAGCSGANIQGRCPPKTPVSGLPCPPVAMRFRAALSGPILPASPVVSFLRTRRELCVVGLRTSMTHNEGLAPRRFRTQLVSFPGRGRCGEP